MCCCGSKCTIIYTSIYTLIQSIAWASLAFTGISLYNCEVDVDPDSPAYYLYFLYFFNPDCAVLPDKLNITDIFCEQIREKIGYTCEEFNNFKEGVTLPPYVTTPDYFAETLPPLPAWPKTFKLVEETHDYMITYSVLSLVWAGSAVILLVTAVLDIRRYFMFIPWVVVSAAVLISDAYYAINYGLEAQKSDSAEGLLRLIGLDELPSFQNYSVNSLLDRAETKAIFMVPSLIMSGVAARAIIFWLKNLLMLIIMIFVIRSFVKNKYPELPRYPHHRKNGAADNKAVEDSNNNPADNIDGNGAYPRQGPYQPSAYQYGAEGYVGAYKPDSPGERYPRPFSYTNGLPAVGGRRQSGLSALPNPADPAPYRPSQPIEPSAPRRPIGPAVLPRPANYPKPSSPEPEYVEPDSAPAPWFLKPNPAPVKRKDTPMDQPEPWRHPVDRNDYHKSQPVDRTDSHRSSASTHPPDELRSQLPWSYYRPRDVPLKSKVKSTQQTVPEEMPPVPVPDYTLHFGKSARPSTAWPEERKHH